MVKRINSEERENLYAHDGIEKLSTINERKGVWERERDRLKIDLYKYKKRTIIFH